MVAENLVQVQKNIEESCKKVNRDPGEVTLIAVSKTKPVEMLQEAYAAGARVFGENKVQEIVDKYDQMPADVQWHMIGHLQRNKVKYIVDKVAMIHSVEKGCSRTDSYRSKCSSGREQIWIKAGRSFAVY